MQRDDAGSVFVLFLDQVTVMFGCCSCLCVFFLVCVCVFSMYRCVHVLVLVTLHVQGQVVGAGEAAAAGDALEGFGSGVFPVVSGELVRSGETPVAVVPCAAVRLLTCVRPLVCLQMGALCVNFGAAWVVTEVDPPLLQLRIVPPVVFGTRQHPLTMCHQQGMWGQPRHLDPSQTLLVRRRRLGRQAEQLCLTIRAPWLRVWR